MKVARNAVLAVAVLAAGGAGLMAMKLMSREPEKQIVVQETTIETSQVLVATNDISMGDKVTSGVISWQSWPSESVVSGYITKSARPDAIKEFSGSIARGQIFASEPIRENKLVNANSGFMSAILPKGQRAVATDISTSTSAGGFILPNDRVDVLMTRKRSGSDDGYVTEVILENIRILAIDQIIEDKEGKSSVVGETATLQLHPRQVEILAVAQETAERLSLSLRSIADSGDSETKEADHLLGNSRGTVRVIRYGNMTESDAPSSADRMKSE